MIDLPFQHLNLRHNPFGELDSQDRATVAQLDLDGLLAHLKRPHAAIQLTGDCGRGKSTHLLAIRYATEHDVYVYCRPDVKTRLPSLTGPLVLVDEAQRLHRADRRRLFAYPRAIAFTSHCDYRQQLEKAGRDVLAIHLGDSLTVEHLQTVLNARIEHARRGPGLVPKVTSATAERLRKQYGSNIRQIESDLYDVFQAMSEYTDV